MGKKKKVKDPDYLTAVKRADREREIALHGKLISTRPLRIEKSKKVYDRNRYRKGGCSHYDDSLLSSFIVTLKFLHLKFRYLLSGRLPDVLIH